MRFILLLAGGLLLIPRAIGAPPEVSPVSEVGWIEGHVHYPACFGPPEDLTVCAEGAGSDATFCTRTLTLTETGFRYRLEVPAGRYLVYSITQEIPDRRAFYSRHVVCGLSVDCPDHTPLPVVVEPGETTTGVDPDDWFAPPEPPPATAPDV